MSEDERVAMSFGVPRNDVGLLLALQAWLTSRHTGLVESVGSLSFLEGDLSFIDYLPALVDEIAQACVFYESNFENCSPGIRALSAWEHRRQERANRKLRELGDDEA